MFYPTEYHLWEDFAALSAAVGYWAMAKVLQKQSLLMQSVSKMSAAFSLWESRVCLDGDKLLCIFYWSLTWIGFVSPVWGI